MHCNQSFVAMKDFTSNQDLIFFVSALYVLAGISLDVGGI